MNKREKLLKILGTRFGDDPKALEMIHEAIAKDYDRRLEEVSKVYRAEIERIQSENRADARERAQEAAMRHGESLAAIREAKADAIGKSTKASEGSVSKAVKELREWVENSVMHRLESHGKAIEKFNSNPGFAIGGPSRTFFIGGSPASTRYSDINLIAGAGITITEADNETTAQAGITITSTGGGGFTMLPATGAVNSINKSFTFTQEPSYIVSDGAWYTRLDNNLNAQWTWDGVSTATMIIPPTASIFGVA